MSNMKNGFSTLNRWLGKKNKTEKATPNGKLSKSSTNLSLSVSTTNINETSQLEYNRITPLPVATSNAPFEQTFRITVLLPKDQLYVARIGARVPLSKLLELVCENKLLDASKYEFRNPVDPSQVYNCDLTIGAVGLSEIRLCHKSESYDNFNADEIIKLHRTAIIRDSLSSSEFSSRYSKHTTKTTSPYSSSNSLNSMDSTGMNCIRTPVTPPATLATTTTPSKISAPPRKKRAAPRPPSQTVIPEKTILVANGDTESNIEKLECSDDSLLRKNRYVSTPNLTVQPGINGIDPNRNINSPTVESEIESSLNGYIHPDIEQEQSQVQQKNARNLYSVSVQNLSSSGVLQQSGDFPEPSPRKRMIQMKKKVAAPAPPSRGSVYADSDTVSIKSLTPSTPDTPLTPSTSLVLSSLEADTILDTQLTTKTFPDGSIKQKSPTSPSRDPKSIATPLQSSTPVLETTTTTESAQTQLEVTDHVPKPLPRATTNTFLNSSIAATEDPPSSLTSANVSKIMLNRTPTPEPRSLSAEPPTSDNHLGAHIAAHKDTSNLETDTSDDRPSQHGESISYLGIHIAALKSASTPETDPPDDEHSKQSDSIGYLSAHIATLKSTSTSEHDDDVLSKQADSGIGEPVPSPIPDSLPSEGSAHEGKSAFESSSDDDDIVKVYNFKLGKTVVKPPNEPQSLEDFVVLAAGDQTDSADNTPAPVTQEATPNFSDSASWNFTIPISPPPNFADGRFTEGFDSEKPSDAPITPKIKERPVLNFESISSTEKSDVQTAEYTNHGATVESDEKHIHIERTALLSSPTTPLNEIVDEHSAIINEKRLDSLIKKADEQPKIEAAKPNTLANFSITTIAEQSRESAPSKPDLASEEKVVNGIKTSPNDAQTSNSVESYKQQIQLAAELINPITPMSLESSLAESSEPKNENNDFSSSRRRSSGELSIGESPSLQSPEVIKTILNSRKNSLASNSDGESKAAVETAKLPENKMADKANVVPIVATQIVEKNEKVKPSTPDLSAAPISAPTKPKEIPKVYRYSGPPSINFSTWNERPKVQVSIKNEGDYIFGGRNADSQSSAVTTAVIEMNTNSKPRGARASMPASAFWTERDNYLPSVAPKPAAIASPTERMGIPEKEYRIPQTAKPLRDFTIENVDPHSAKKNSAQQKLPTNSTYRKSTSITTVLLNGNSGSEANRSESFTKRSFGGTTHTSTLPRSNANRFTTPVANIVGPALLRSTSITQLEASKPQSTPTEIAPAPFGQNTLRKTGLKEKILAKEAEEQQMAKLDSVLVVQPSKPQESNTRYATTISNGFISITKPVATSEKGGYNRKTVKPVKSAKLELKLQNSTSVYLNRTSTSSPTTPITTSKTQSAATSAPITPIAPPPPPPAPTKGVTLRTPNGSPITTPSSPDPRDQLLVAIRNFKRDNLNRV